MRMLMEKKQMTMRNLSSIADIPFPTVNRILSGEVIDPTLSVLKKLSAALGVTLSQLVGEEALPNIQ